MTLGKVARAESRDRNQAPLMNPYRAADGRWFFFTGLEAARHIPAVCRALGRPDLLDDPRFADAACHPAQPDRGHRPPGRDHRPSTLSTSGPSDSTAEGVWWAPAQTPAEVVDDPQLLVNDGIVEIDGGAGGAVQRSVNGPVSFSDVASRRYAPVPGLGEHTEEVLAELAEPAADPPGPSSSAGLGPADPGR